MKVSVDDRPTFGDREILDAMCDVLPSRTTAFVVLHVVSKDEVRVVSNMDETAVRTMVLDVGTRLSGGDS